MILRRNREILLSNLQRCDGFFAARRDLFEWVRPRAGLVAFQRLRAALPIEQFVEELAADEGVLLVPGTVFDHPGSHFRLGLGRRNLPEALARLERFAERRLRRV